MTITPEVLAILDRLTSPIPVALADVQEALQRLEEQIASVDTATDDDGDECAAYLHGLAFDTSNALDRLAEAIKENER